MLPLMEVSVGCAFRPRELLNLAPGAPADGQAVVLAPSVLRFRHRVRPIKTPTEAALCADVGTWMGIQGVSCTLFANCREST